MKYCQLTLSALCLITVSACTVLQATQDGTVVSQPAPIAVPVPIIIGFPTDNTNIKTSKETETKKQDEADKSIHVCTLNAFTSHYRAENTNRGRARLNVKNQCLKQFDEMFCRDKDITCVEYD